MCMCVCVCLHFVNVFLFASRRHRREKNAIFMRLNQQKRFNQTFTHVIQHGFINEITGWPFFFRVFAVFSSFFLSFLYSALIVGASNMTSMSISRHLCTLGPSRRVVVFHRWVLLWTRSDRRTTACSSMERNNR